LDDVRRYITAQQPFLLELANLWSWINWCNAKVEPNGYILRPLMGIMEYEIWYRVIKFCTASPQFLYELLLWITERLKDVW